MLAAMEMEKELEKWDGKHPLMNTWVLWYSDLSLSSKWADCIKEVGSFCTVEDFWSIHNFLKPVSQLRAGCDFYVFKKGVQPMWEDKANKSGGRWDIAIERNTDRQIDAYWLELLMVMVGESFCPHSDIVTGAVVSLRERNYRISLWTTVANDRDRLCDLGKKIRQFLGIPIETRIHFRTHEAAKCSFRQNSSIFA